MLCLVAAPAAAWLQQPFAGPIAAHRKLGLPRVAAVASDSSDVEGLREALEAVLRGSEVERQMTDVADLVKPTTRKEGRHLSARFLANSVPVTRSR